MSWTPQAADFSAAITDQNPWQSLGKVPEELAKPVRRHIVNPLAAVLQRSKPHRFQLILGPRRIGKTTAMYQAIAALLQSGIPASRLWWLRLDHPLLMQRSLGELIESIRGVSKASQKNPVYVFLDELIYASDWDRWLKTFYDDHWPVRVLGTSSSTAALKLRRLESGVGRWEEQYMAPWLFSEYLALRGRKPTVEVGRTLAETLSGIIDAPPALEGLDADRRRFLLIGGFPELLTLDPTGDETSELLRSQQVLRSDAVERALYRDLPQAYGISEPLKLERLLYTLAGQISGVVSGGKLATDLGLSQPTVDKYVRYLEDAFLVFTLPNYSASEETVQRRGRKLYFTDGAVRNAALQRGIAPLRDPSEMGLLYENVVAAHLHALSQQTRHRLYHWRMGNTEIDLVYDDPEGPLAFEIASRRQHHRKGLIEFQRSFPRFRNRCFMVSPDPGMVVPSDASGGIGHIPMDALLIAAGLQSDQALHSRLT